MKTSKPVTLIKESEIDGKSQDSPIHNISTLLKLIKFLRSSNLLQTEFTLIKAKFKRIDVKNPGEDSAFSLN